MLVVRLPSVPPELDTKSACFMAIQQARRLKMTRNLFEMMHICSAVVLSFLDSDFESLCPAAAAAAACC